MRTTAPRRSAMVTRSWAWRATDRDLRRSARILSCAAMLKTKKPATASVAAAGILKKRKKPATLSVAGAILKRKKPASSASVEAEIRIPEGAGKILEPSELLKLKKKAYEAKYLWEERYDPGALERWKAAEAKAEEEEAKAAAEEAQPEPKKRKRLVIKRLPDWRINVMKEDPYLIKPIPDDELEKLDSMSYGFAEVYRMRKFIDDKMYAYEQALINQHNILGYAEDVDEVTDDEQD